MVSIMKRIFIMAALPLIFAACSKEAPAKEDPAGEGTAIVESGKKSINVNIAQFKAPAAAAETAEEAETRVAFGTESGGAMPLVWSEGDEIALIQDKGLATQKVSVFRLSGTGGSENGTFVFVSGDEPGDDANLKDAIYPASAFSSWAIPQAQTYSAGTIDKNAAVMTWHSDSGIGVDGITFSPLGSVVCLQLTGINTLSVTSVTVTVDSKPYTLSCTTPVTPLEDAIPFYVSVPGCSAQTIDFDINFKYGEAAKTVKKATFDKAFETGKLHRFPAKDIVDVGDLIDGGMVFTNYLRNTTAAPDNKSKFVKIMSLDGTADICFSTENVHLGTERTNENKLTRDDGTNNREKILSTPNYSAETYPAPAWCHSHGEGWHLPTDMDLVTIQNSFLYTGSTSKTLANKCQSLIVHFGGTMLPYNTASGLVYISSTESEDDASMVRTRWLSTKKKNAGTVSKSNNESIYIRAVKVLNFE